MKKNRDIIHFEWFSSFVMNVLKQIRGIYRLLRALGVAIVFFSIVAAIIIGALHLFVPKKLEYMDRKATMRIFDALQSAGRHHEAIAIMEYKGDMLKESSLEEEYRIKLSDSYVAVGDYSKAENQLLYAWKQCLIKCDTEEFNIEKIEGAPLEGLTKEAVVDFVTFGLSRTIYQFYEKIGDVENMKKFFALNSKAYHGGYKQCSEAMGKLNDKNVRLSKMDELFEHDSIVVVSFDDKQKAIRLMDGYTSKIMKLEDYNPMYKVKCLNTLIGWELEQGKKFDAYSHIYLACQLVKMMRSTTEFACLGDLCDYLYEIKDIPLSKSMCTRYQAFLDDNYGHDDYEYLKNRIRLMRFLEADGKWDELTNELESYCHGMQKHILVNIASMTEEQREFYVKEFDMGYDMAFHVLQKKASPKLATLCFENVTFKNGLLLRSNMALENKIRISNDKESLKKLEELRACQKELAYLDVSRIVFNNANKLRKRISTIEKELALKYTDFATLNDVKPTSVREIQRSLADDEVVVLLSESDGELFSLTLRNKGDVQYDHATKKSAISKMLNGAIEDLYHNVNLTNALWSKVQSRVEGCSTIYYQPMGVFSQIAPNALYVGNDTYLCDKWNFVLVSNPADVIKKSEFDIVMNNAKQSVSLWGGIDYGDNDNEIVATTAHKRSAIVRGEKLVNLSYAYQEVMDISNELRTGKHAFTLHSGLAATEQAFKKQSGQDIYIIHVSTHGFFNDKIRSLVPMLESGLFFSGSNHYWTDDSLNATYSDEDGILRSAEISQLNLSSCALVVLSACETGLGFNDSSEGIYGLQRAFKLAGVKQVLMSLWDVDDRATALLMTEFYKNLLRGNNTSVALEKAQRGLREQGYSPEQWGAFVLLH